jgi:hypothetical protein
MNTEDPPVRKEVNKPPRIVALFAFLPWIVYIVGSAGQHWAIATAGGTLACIIYLAMLRRHSTIKLMDWTTLAFFISASVLMIGLHSTRLPVYQVMIIWAFYAVAGWSSVIMQKPFTTAYAREEQPPEVWDLPIFRHINWILTLFWCGLFSVNVGFGAAAALIGGNFGKLVLGFLIPTALLIFAFIFSARFPLYYVQRANSAEAAVNVSAG